MIDDNILGAVLAGGKSKRFGTNKSEIIFKHKKLINYTLDKLKNKLKNIIIVSNDIKYNDYPTIKDCIDGQLGPLVGVLSAMKWAKKNKNNIKWIATFPCDTPFFDISILEKFQKASNSKASKLYFAKTENKRHNIFGLWSMDLMDKLEEDLVINSIRKVEEWANKIGVEVINFKTEKYDMFFNINTKDDLKYAEDILNKIYND